MILKAYWGLGNFVVLYTWCSQKPLMLTVFLFFFPLNQLLTPSCSLANCLHPRRTVMPCEAHLLCMIMFGGREGVGTLFVFFHAESYLSSSPTFLFHFWRYFQFFSFFNLHTFSHFLHNPVTSPLLAPLLDVIIPCLCFTVFVFLTTG